MTFPANNPVQQLPFTGGGQDILGNDIESWAPAQQVYVTAYQPSAVESINGYTSRVESDIDMAVPVWVPVTVRDRFLLPDEGEQPYEVTAIEDANHGIDPTFTPGSIVKLKRVSGGG
jgi:hypothetical protein